LGDARSSPHLSMIALGCLCDEIRGAKDRVAILRDTTSVIMSTSRLLGVDNRMKSKVSNSIVAVLLPEQVDKLLLWYCRWLNKLATEIH